MTLQTVLYQADGPIGTITLNRPEKMNAFGAQMLADFDAALTQAERDDSVRVVIIKGAGRAFSAGYDISPGEFSPHEQTSAKTASGCRPPSTTGCGCGTFPSR